MSPTTDDLRALLELRAGTGAPAGASDVATGARLAGVRARVRQRQRVRTGAAALALALLAGSAGVATTHWWTTRAAGPAEGGPLPLAADLRISGGGARTTLAGGDELHLSLTCSDDASVRAVVLVNGRGAVALPCSGGSTYRSFAAADEAWGMRADRPTTIGVYLVAAASTSAIDLGSPAARGRADLKVYSRSSITPPIPDPPVPADVQETAATPVVLGGLARPVTADFGTRSFTVVPGAYDLVVTAACSSTKGGPEYYAVVSVNGHSLGAFGCASTGPVNPSPGGSLSAPGNEAFWRARGVEAGKPAAIGVRLATTDDGGTPRHGHPLDRTLPGAEVRVTVAGTPYLPSDILRPPASATPASP